LTSNELTEDIFRLDEVIYDVRARDGTLCCLPYPLPHPDHPLGCPNFPRCRDKYPDFKTLEGYEWYAVVEEFDLKSHAERMKKKHPNWTERQCRNLLYWQKGVQKKLKDKAIKFTAEKRFLGDNFSLLLEVPEACGIDLFATMEKVGVKLQRNPDLVRKIMLVGRKIRID